MGVTVRYRGRLEDLTLLEPLEDCVIDLALALGGRVRMEIDGGLRSAPDGTRRPLGPGSGLRYSRTALLARGWLVPLHAIEDAERGCFDEPPWVFVKTQFAAPEAHVALIEALHAIRVRFMPGLEVQDEGGYWGTRDVQGLLRKRHLVDQALDSLKGALENDGLSLEAREDPGILATRITRLAAMVHRTLWSPSEHAAARIGEADPPWAEWERTGTEAEWDAFYAEQRRKQERVQRHVAEALAKGADPVAALEGAMESEGVGLHPARDPRDPEPTSFGGDPEEMADPWSPDSASLHVAPELEDEPARRHPLQQQATDLIVRVLCLIRSCPVAREPLEDLEAALMDVGGGLAQALGASGFERDGPVGWTLVQLKRALRGAGFARGALVRARQAGCLDQDTFEEVDKVVDEIEGGVIDEVRAARHDLLSF